MTLVMKVGGASGPLFGTLFMALGKELPAEPTRADLVAASARRSTRSRRAASPKPGRRPCSTCWCRCKRYWRRAAMPRAIAAEAAQAAERTEPMQAIRGRASFLGERSIGHMDPGRARRR